MESWLFQYSLGEQKLPGFFLFNLAQMIRRQYLNVLVGLINLAAALFCHSDPTGLST
jgi:hypothetical protein